MKYLVLLMGDGEEIPWNEQSPEQQAASIEKFGAFSAACAQRSGVQILAGVALGAPGDAKVMRSRAGQVSITDGPYAEAIEGLGGFYLVESPDLDTLFELLRLLPAYDIQVAPVVDPV